MPSGVDPQYRYGQAKTEESLSQVLSDQQALAWRAHQLWQRDAAAAGLHSQEATALLQHLRRVDPDLSSPRWRTYVPCWTNSSTS